MSNPSSWNTTISQRATCAHQLICYLCACDNLCSPLEVIWCELSLEIVEKVEGDCKSVDMLIKRGKVSELIICDLHGHTDYQRFAKIAPLQPAQKIRAKESLHLICNFTLCDVDEQVLHPR